MMMSCRWSRPLCLLFLLVMPAWLEKYIEPYRPDQWDKYCMIEMRRLRHYNVELLTAQNDQDSEGGVKEGSAVILRCPVYCRWLREPPGFFSWFKNDALLPTNASQINLDSVSREDSGNYTCAVAEYGSQRSLPVTLSVRYSPKVVAVSIVMRCEADGEPPVQEYVWFKDGEAFPVAFGQSIRIANALVEDISQYHCKVQNYIGTNSARLAPPVSHTVMCHKTLAVAAGIGGCCGALAVAVLFAGLWMRNKKKKTSSRKNNEDIGKNAKDDTYTELDPKTTSSSDVYTNLRSVHRRAPESTTYV